MELDEIVRIYYPVSDAGMKALQEVASLIQLRKGEILIHQCDMGGGKDDNIYFVKNGLLRSFHEENGEDDTMWFATTGDAVASMHSFYANLPAIASIEALIDTALYCVAKEDLDRLFSESKELVTWGYRLAVEALYSLERRYRYIGMGDAYMRYKRFMEMRQKEVIQQIPLKYIASYLNIAPQTLSRLRRKLARE